MSKKARKDLHRVVHFAQRCNKQWEAECWRHEEAWGWDCWQGVGQRYARAVFLQAQKNPQSFSYIQKWNERNEKAVSWLTFKKNPKQLRLIFRVFIRNSHLYLQPNVSTASFVVFPIKQIHIWQKKYFTTLNRVSLHLFFVFCQCLCKAVSRPCFTCKLSHCLTQWVSTFTTFRGRTEIELAQKGKNKKKKTAMRLHAESFSC